MTNASELGNIVGVGCAPIWPECWFHIYLKESIVGEWGYHYYCYYLLLYYTYNIYLTITGMQVTVQVTIIRHVVFGVSQRNNAHQFSRYYGWNRHHKILMALKLVFTIISIIPIIGVQKYLVNVRFIVFFYFQLCILNINIIICSTAPRK